MMDHYSTLTPDEWLHQISVAVTYYRISGDKQYLLEIIEFANRLV